MFTLVTSHPLFSIFLPYTEILLAISDCTSVAIKIHEKTHINKIIIILEINKKIVVKKHERRSHTRKLIDQNSIAMSFVRD